MSFALTPPPHTPPASQALNPGTLGHLKFCEAGLVALRSYLGDGEIYRLFKARFDAADAAWLVSGSHTDGTHEVNPSSFHPSWTDFRPTHAKDKREAWQIRHDQREKLKSVIFDAITALDRITGGASLLIQFDGTVRPQQAIELSALKFDVYFPPHLLQENPGLDRVIARIVQEFAEHVGLPTAERWLLAFKKTGLGKLERETSPPEPVGGHFPPRPYLPPPQTNSSRFECFGRVKGELDAMDKVTPPPGFTVDRDGPSRRSGLAVASSATATPTPKLLQTLNEDNDVLRYELDTLREDYTALQDENDAIREENNILRGRVEDMEALLEDRDKTITGLREGAANTAMTTTTSSKSRVHDTDTSGMAGLSARMLHVRAPAAPVPKTPVQFRVSPTPATTPSPTAATGRASKSPVPPVSASSLLFPVATPMPSVAVARSTSSISSALSSLPSSPVMSQEDWEMPSNPFASPLPALSPSLSRSNREAAASPAPAQSLTRYRMLGPASHKVLQKHKLPFSLHREFRTLVEDFPQECWVDGLREYGVPEDLLAELVDAMCLDAPLE